ncbi:S8 family peptidase [Amycolatopsis sp. CA-230715]|uniref:S8 family peptidase n=1 Tax=Amycolatopsis sp. CA-230715 TaxID=2745196 RepID=UPI0020B40D54|nr:S8 family serine peptidase [Amycolatopsis sp. CA-230715]
MATAVLLLSPFSPAAAGPTSPTAAPVRSAQPDARRVTLLTGDVVTYQPDGAGHGSAQIEAAERPDRPRPAFQILTTADGLMVYPSDALPLITSGLLSRDLFNLTELVADGRDDAKNPTIPIIARYGAGTGLSAQSLDAKARPLPHVRRLLPLPTVDSVGLLVEKSGTGEFWRSLVTAGPGGKPALRNGISRIQPDRKIRAALDKSTVQVGAPAAWAKGLTGAGTTVAVVDSGIDEQHPDLAGKTVGSADFSGEGDIVDRYGHGTHVASIIAGTGAASGGKYRGVAPDAKLLVAKVFGASGESDTAQVMSGVDWAVGQGAKVVNLSLGAGISDGADPLSEQVDTLSAKNGTLFVVAAGNSGPGERTVTTPGSAAAALTVGAVDRDNSIAWFSSRGPRLRDALVKPEISAPGVGIVAARAAGTSMGEPVDDFYTRQSGTSMATPHVAGAAAILLQQHPGLSGSALKDILVSTAKDVGLRWYEQGSGLLDIAKAVGQEATGTAVASFGRLDRATGAAPAARPLTYTNTGDQPLSLKLDLSVRSWDGDAKPVTGLRLSSAEVTVPPKSTKTVTLTNDPGEGRSGVYGGAVVAATTDGKVTVRTAMSTYNAAPLFPVTLRVTDSAGAPADLAAMQLIDDANGAGNRNDPFLDQVSQQVDLVNGTGRVAVPAGSYSALGWVVESGSAQRRWSALSVAEVPVSAPTEIKLSAQGAVPVRLVTPTPTDQRDRTVMLRRAIPAAPGGNGYVGEAGLSAGSGDWDVRVTPSAPAKKGAISLQDSATLAQAAVDLSVAGTTTALHPAYDVPSLTASLPGKRTLPVVFGGDGSAAALNGLDVRGKAVLVRIPVAADPASDVFLGATNAARAAAAAGAAVVLPYAEAANSSPIAGLTGTVLSLSQAEGEGLRAKAAAGATSVDLLIRSAPDAMYNLSYLDGNGVPKDHVRQVDPKALVATKTSYHADRPGLSGQKNWYAFPTGLWKTQPVQGTKIPVPGTWTEYTGPGDDRQVWKRVVTLSGNDDTGKRASLSMNDYNIYRAGEPPRPGEDWFQSTVHSTAAELAPDHPSRYPATAAGWTMLCSLCRGGTDPDLFVPALQWADGRSAGHFTSPYENARYFTTTTARMFHDGAEIPRDNGNDPLALFPVFRLSPSPGVYRLDVTDVFSPQAQVGAPSTVLFGNATRTDTSWTFASARSTAAPPPGFSCYGAGSCAFQPLIQLDYRLPLDLSDRAPAGVPFTFDVVAASHSGAKGGGPVTSLRVSSSADNGATWSDATAKPQGGGRWSVTVANPGTAGSAVWLRAEARDGSGNTVEQTVQRAYAISGQPGSR